MRMPVEDEASAGKPKLPIIAWTPPRCPWCDSEDVIVTGRGRLFKRLRYHRCRSCGKSFKSYERTNAIKTER